MKSLFTTAGSTRMWTTLALALAVFLVAPTLVSAEEPVANEPIVETSVQKTVLVDADGLPTVAFASSKPNNLNCERCNCIQQATPPTTRVGATCLKARQKAAAAARALAVCAPQNPSCGPVTHSVAPCVPLSTGGFSATATAYFSCEYCIDICL